MEYRRSDIINVAKAIGIILMVIGHSGCPSWLHDFIYVFHMPLFFFLSGYCMKEFYLDHRLLFVKKRMKRLWLTFVKWNLVFLAANPLFFRIGITDEYYQLEDMPGIIGKVLIMNFWHELLGTFWFLRYLLLSSISVLFICSMLRRHQRLCLALFLLMPVVPTALSLLGIGGSLKGQGLVCCFFYYAGFYLHNIQPTWRSWQYPLSVVFTITVSFFLKTEIPAIQPHQTLLYAISAMIGISATMATSSLICEKSQWATEKFTYVGQNTIIIMVWHLVAFKIVSFVAVTTCSLPPEQLYYITITTNNAASLLWIAYSLAGLALPLLLITLKDRLLKAITHSS